MKTRIVIFCLLLMLSAFAGSAWAWHETDSNTWFGLSAGNNAGLTGTCNTFIGAYSGLANTTGYQNTFMGYNTGTLNTTGALNTSIGQQAGEVNNGDANTFLGFSAGINNATGSANTFIGTAAGNFATGSGNVFLGYSAGSWEFGSNKLYIANSDTTAPLIYGDFSTPSLTVNGSLGIGTSAPARQLHLAGDNAVFRIDRPRNTAAFLMVRTDASGNPQKTFIVGTDYDTTNGGSFVIKDIGTATSGDGPARMTIQNNGNVVFTGTATALAHYNSSSITLKDNVRTYENALDTVSKLRGVKFYWKDSGKPSVGLIAEEVEKVVPEIVAHHEGNATGVNYASLVGVLVAAVKEQQTEMNHLKTEVQQLRALLQTKQ